jgi:hypothetical protein
MLLGDGVGVLAGCASSTVEMQPILMWGSILGPVRPILISGNARSCCGIRN